MSKMAYMGAFYFKFLKVKSAKATPPSPHWYSDRFLGSLSWSQLEACSLGLWKKAMFTSYPGYPKNSLKPALESYPICLLLCKGWDCFGNPIPWSRMKENMKSGQKDICMLSVKECLQKKLPHHTSPSYHWPVCFHVAKARKSSLQHGCF